MELYLATPLFMITVLMDSILAGVEGLEMYQRRDTLNNLLIGAMGTIMDLLVKSIFLLLFSLIYLYRWFDWEYSVWYWVILFLLHDLLFYWIHFLEHRIRFLWASHFIHHSSGKFNFSTSIRVSVFQPLYRYLFYIPLVLSGFSPIDILLVHSLSKIYVFFLHTERIGKLGPFEWLMNTPSHHRVHHGSNPEYIDRNMGNVLIIWDRIFGTFQEELDSVPVRFGTTSQPDKPNILSHLFFEFANIHKDVAQAHGIKAKCMSIIKMKKIK